MTTGSARPERARSGRIVVVGLVVVTCLALLTACDSGTGSSATTKTTPTTAAPIVEKDMQVDLRLVGDPASLTMDLRGTKGKCRLPTNGLPASYVISSADFPALGTAGSFKVYSATGVRNVGYIAPNAVAYIKGLGIVSQPSGVGVTIQPDRQVVTLNALLTGGPGGSFATNLEDPKNTVTAHVVGTLRCV